MEKEIRHGLWYSARNACFGLFQIARSRIFLLELVLGVGAITLSWILDLTIFTRIVVVTFSVLVLCFEGFNSALEKLLDLVSPDYSIQVKTIKDMLAGTVLIGAIGAVLVGILILLRLLKVIGI